MVTDNKLASDLTAADERYARLDQVYLDTWSACHDAQEKLTAAEARIVELEAELQALKVAGNREGFISRMGLIRQLQDAEAVADRRLGIFRDMDTDPYLRAVLGERCPDILKAIDDELTQAADAKGGRDE